MSQKKVRAIRKLAKAMGHYKKEPNYKLKETKKMVYGLDKDGKPMAQQITRYTVINTSKTVYRQMLKDYHNGKFTI